MISVHLAYAASQALRAHAGTIAIRPGAHLVVEVAGASHRRAAPPARPVRLAQDLTAPVSDGVAAPQATLARAEAARGFAIGTFYLPGQIVDRHA